MRLLTKSICAISGVIFLVMTSLIIFANRFVHSVDNQLRIVVNRSRTPAANRFFTNFTQLFNAKETIIWVVIVITLAWMLSNRRFTLQVTLSMITVLILNRLIKLWIQRPRPATNLLMHYGSYSFPSGHSSAAAAIIGCLILLIWRVNRRRWVKVVGTICFIILVIVVGYSRIYVGAHFPSDVLAGWCLGTFVVTAYHIIFNK